MNNRQLALQELIDAFVRARVYVQGDDFKLWKTLLRYEAKIEDLKREAAE